MPSKRESLLEKGQKSQYLDKESQDKDITN